jgi:hypothetical protein
MISEGNNESKIKTSYSFRRFFEKSRNNKGCSTDRNMDEQANTKVKSIDFVKPKSIVFDHKMLKDIYEESTPRAFGSRRMITVRDTFIKLPRLLSQTNIKDMSKTPKTPSKFGKTFLSKSNLNIFNKGNLNTEKKVTSSAHLSILDIVIYI